MRTHRLPLCVAAAQSEEGDAELAAFFTYDDYLIHVQYTGNKGLLCFVYSALPQLRKMRSIEAFIGIQLTGEAGVECHLTLSSRHIRNTMLHVYAVDAIRVMMNHTLKHSLRELQPAYLDNLRRFEQEFGVRGLAHHPREGDYDALRSAVQKGVAQLFTRKSWTIHLIGQPNRQEYIDCLINVAGYLRAKEPSNTYRTEITYNR